MARAGSSTLLATSVDNNLALSIIYLACDSVCYILQIATPCERLFDVCVCLCVGAITKLKLISQ